MQLLDSLQKPLRELNAVIAEAECRRKGWDTSLYLKLRPVYVPDSSRSDETDENTDTVFADFPVHTTKGRYR